MARHGKAGPNAVPAGNRQGQGPATSQIKSQARGRTAGTTNPDPNAGPDAREGNVLQERRTEVSRPIGRGGGKLRGDRQDTHPDPGIRAQRDNRGLRTDRDPQSTAGRRRNRVPNEGG